MRMIETIIDKIGAIKISKKVFTAILLGAPIVFFSTLAFYTVEEGHVGIIKRFGKVVDQVGPGLHIKIPVADQVVEIEVRQRKNVEDLAAATANQLPIKASISINWTVNSESAKSLYVKYGGLKQFESRILDPKLRSASKAALSKFSADRLIIDRQVAVSAIMEAMLAELEGFPVTVNSPQIENIILPPTYVQAVLAKEQAREDAEKEKHVLERQRLNALREVNSAEASATSKRLAADAEAYRLVTEAKAEAEAIRLVATSLGDSPAYIELSKAKKWDGTLPQTMLSDGASVILK